MGSGRGRGRRMWSESVMLEMGLGRSAPPPARTKTRQASTAGRIYIFGSKYTVPRRRGAEGGPRYRRLAWAHGRHKDVGDERDAGSSEEGRMPSEKNGTSSRIGGGPGARTQSRPTERRASGRSPALAGGQPVTCHLRATDTLT